MATNDFFDTRFENPDIEVPQNLLEKGGSVNITNWDPAMRRITIGVGWELLAFDGNPVDLDVSCFLLNKDEKTRMDTDFVFYNNPEGCKGAVIHQGDNRSGAGDGDDETIYVNLNDIPFDVLSLMIVLSIYRGDEREQYMSKLRNAYVRIVNRDNDQEVLRYIIDKDVAESKETAMLAGCLERDGSKWVFKALGTFVKGGLPKVATSYDIIVQGG